jgi:hypothetical protein
MSDTTLPPDDADSAKLLRTEAALEHLLHWWREPLAGVLALGVGVYDSWFYGRDAGLSSSLDEILIIGGVVLIAGSRQLFLGTGPVQPHPNGNGKPKGG